jgi:type III secretory pathway component EscR
MTKEKIIVISLVGLLSIWIIYIVGSNVSENKRKNDLEQQRITIAKEKQEQEEKEYEDKVRQAEEVKLQLNSCLENAYENYSNGWDTSCKNLGREANCQLPNYLAETHTKSMTEAKELCIKINK